MAKSGKERILYLPFDQLHLNYGVLKSANPKTDLVVMVESQGMLQSQPWHIQRLYFLISSARHFVLDLQAKGFEVRYLKSENTLSGIKQIQKETGINQVLAAQPSSFRLSEKLAEEVNFIDNDFFLTSRKEFADWAKSQKKLLMENFYRLQRKKYGILMDGDEPTGGKWNYDAENRNSLPKDYKFPPYLTHEMDEIDQAVLQELNDSNLKMWGNQPDGVWGTTRAAALKTLKHFVKHHLAGFGPFEDAITSENWAVHHSLLSPYLNNGLLHINDVLRELKKFEDQVPLASLEGIIRQLIGWREYVNGLYWYFGAEYRNENFWKAKNELPPIFTNPDHSEITCIRETVKDVRDRAWVHHIPRLMLLSNFAFITQTKPQALLNWMRQVFIDATDWVMVPNVIGMSMNADGGKMMSKPYLAGGSYISKMSNYCGSCKFNPKERTGPTACPITQFYWNTVDINFETLKKNPRIAMQVSGRNRLADLPLIKLEAAENLKLLQKGEL